jgi:hypothetical protein
MGVVLGIRRPYYVYSCEESFWIFSLEGFLGITSIINNKSESIERIFYLFTPLASSL